MRMNEERLPVCVRLAGVYVRTCARAYIRARFNKKCDGWAEVTISLADNSSELNAGGGRPRVPRRRPLMLSPPHYLIRDSAVHGQVEVLNHRDLPRLRLERVAGQLSMSLGLFDLGCQSVLHKPVLMPSL